MKNLLPILVFLTFLACKNDSNKVKPESEDEQLIEKSADSFSVSDKDLKLMEQTLDIKRKELLEKKDQKEELETLLVSKSILKKDEWFTLDFKYPYLNEKIKQRRGII